MTTTAVYGPCYLLAVCTLWIYHLAQVKPSGGQTFPGLRHLGRADMVRTYGDQNGTAARLVAEYLSFIAGVGMDQAVPLK